MRAIAPPTIVLLLLATAHPALAQDVTATLRVNGQVMVSAGGDFVTARDGQPVLAGQRLLIGDGASATVEYGRDCKRSFDTAGVHVIPPGRCDEDRDDDSREEDRSRQREPSTEQGMGQGGATVSSAATPWTALATALGAVAATGALMEQQEDSPPDHPISR